jgi:hypothetical protein
MNIINILYNNNNEIYKMSNLDIIIIEGEVDIDIRIQDREQWRNSNSKKERNKDILKREEL